jgi:VCBS repeat-containing protein
MANPSLTNLASSVVFSPAEAASGKILDSDVTFSDPDEDFNGGKLIVTGLLNEDRVTIVDQGTGAGQIGLSSHDVTFGGTVIGTYTGGIGTPLVVTFNAGADSTAIDALVQDLSYQDISATPTDRTLHIDILDAAGHSIGAFTGADTFGDGSTASPLDGVPLAFTSNSVTPSFADVDGDGLVDMVVGADDGSIHYFHNEGGSFVEKTGTDNPFDAVDTPSNFLSAPVFADVVGDSKVDLIVGQSDGTLRVFENGGGTFTEVTGAANPFDGMTFGAQSMPAFGDIDGDGDTDVIVGTAVSGFQYLLNNGNGTYTTEASAADLPYSQVLSSDPSPHAPALADVDGDGDLDLVVGWSDGTLTTWTNDGTGHFGTTPSSVVPGVYGDQSAAPTFVDLDGDGDLDMVVGKSVYSYADSSHTPGLATFFNTTPARGEAISVDIVTNHAPVVDLNGGGAGIDDTNIFAEDNGPSGIGTAIAVSDADGDNIQRADVTIANAQAGDELVANTPLPGGITIDPGSTATHLILVGSASAADYETALGQLGFNNNGDDPTVHGTQTSRTIHVTVNDGTIDSDAATMTMTVFGVNDAPVAQPDSYSTNEDTALNVNAANGVLANDTDPDTAHGWLAAILVTGPANASSFTLNADGSFDYTPGADYNGPDSFTYKVNDGTTDGNTVTVSLTVDPVNDAPVAQPDSYSTNEDTALNVNAANGVLANDSDIDTAHGSLTAILVTGPANALSFTLNADGSFDYTPGTDYNGPDSFTYKVNDGTADGNTVTVSLTVDPVNDAPAVDLNGADPGTSATLDYTENDLLTQIAPHATVVDVDSPDFDTGTLTVAFTANGTADDRLGIKDEGGGAGQITLVGSDVYYNFGHLDSHGNPVFEHFDSGGNPKGPELIGSFSGGGDGSTPLTVTLNATANAEAAQALVEAIGYFNVSDTPSTDPRTVTFTLTDGDGATSDPVDATINVTAVADSAVVNDDTFNTDENVPVAGNLFNDNGNGNDFAPDGAPLVITSVNGSSAAVGHTITLPSGAKLTVNSDGSFNYDPNGAFNSLVPGSSGAVNFFDSDHFTYTTTGGGAATATVFLNGVESPGDIYKGDGTDNTITGTEHGDFFMLQQGGHDTVFGLGGVDAFYFGAALDAGDAVDGGGGKDIVAIQGNYSGGLILGTHNLDNVETLSILTHSDTRFGGGSPTGYSYDITSVDANVAAGHQLIVNASSLESGENFTFDGSAETDGGFLIYGGAGTDNLTGGANTDVFFFAEGRYNAGDTVNGGGGNDILVLRGDYSGVNAVTFGGEAFTSIETVTLMSASDTRFFGGGTRYSYDITTNDNNLAEGATMTFNGGALRADETLRFNGSAETDGNFRIFGGDGNDGIVGGAGHDLIYGGLGADTMAGGAGNDVFRYQSVAESTTSARDTIQDFTLGDLIDLSRIDARPGTAGDDSFNFVAGFTGHAGELTAAQTGPGSNTWIVSGDVDGDGNADFQMVVVSADHHPITGSDFVL